MAKKSLDFGVLRGQSILQHLDAGKDFLMNHEKKKKTIWVIGPKKNVRFFFFFFFFFLLGFSCAFGLVGQSHIKTHRPFV